MNQALLLRLHRWLALAFALPLLVIVLTGLILSFEPIVSHFAVQPRSLTVQSLEAVLERHDPQGSAQALFLRPLDGTVSLGGVRAGGLLAVSLHTGEPASSGATTMSDVFGVSRRIHERLILGGGRLVIASTIVMLLLVGLGLVMGRPRLRNTLSGWHKALGWLPLPLIILSPLTGLLLAFGISFAPPGPGRTPGPPLSMVDAVRIIGAEHDLSSLDWIRSIGGTLVARIREEGETRTYAIARDGMMPDPRNWPRLIHEGTWGGIAPAILNVAASLALLGLLGTGLLIWARRKLRRRPRPRWGKA